MTALHDRPTVADGHLLLNRLVTEGLPRPQHATVRTDHGELTLSLTFDDRDTFGLWAAQMDTDSAVAPGPWQVGPLAYAVAVGRVAGVMTVLATEVDPPAEPQTQVAS